MSTYEKWNSQYKKTAKYYDNVGGYVAKRTSHSGAMDEALINRQTMQPKVFKTPEEALSAKSDKNHIWYH